MSTQVIAVVCRRCRVPRAARHVPDFCGCGARFDRDDHAVIEMSLALRGSALVPSFSVRLVGNGWTPDDARDLVEAAEGELRARDAGERGT